MAYIYDTDILAALWTGGEDGEEPYATFIADNPDLTDEDSENRILSTIEAIRSHMEVLADRDEARLFHFCISTMLEGFGSGGFIYGATSGNENAVIEGNMPNPVFAASDEIEFAVLDGATGGASIAVVAAGGTDIAAVVATSTIAADRALKAIKVEYEEYKPILSPKQAMSEGATQLHIGYEKNILATLRVKERTYKKPNDTYFAEKFQSDWAVEGRKLGFKTND